LRAAEPRKICGDEALTSIISAEGGHKGVLNKIKYLLSAYLPFVQFPYGSAGRELLDAVLDDILWTIYQKQDCATVLLESINLDCQLSISNRDVTALNRRFQSATPTKFSVAVCCDILIRLARQQEMAGNGMLKLIEPNILAAIYTGLPSDRTGLPATARSSHRSSPSKPIKFGREVKLLEVYTAMPYFELDTKSRTNQQKQMEEVQALKRSNKVCSMLYNRCVSLTRTCLAFNGVTRRPDCRKRGRSSGI
jgi:hypothetical protein